MVKRFPGPRLALSAPWSPCPMASPSWDAGRLPGRPWGDRTGAHTGSAWPRSAETGGEAKGGARRRREPPGGVCP